MVPKAKDKARSKSTVLEPDLIHCSIVSSKTKVVYMCSSLLQLASGSCYLFQADKRITVKNNTQNCPR